MSALSGQYKVADVSLSNSPRHPCQVLLRFCLLTSAGGLSAAISGWVGAVSIGDCRPEDGLGDVLSAMADTDMMSQA